ncbi:MAG: ABC transporter ATP-binding protein/permease [Pseudomonadota bacterium]|nr:ABC transporter ATP-binding protein/permease [Pseudomonadota bacterium]
MKSKENTGFEWRALKTLSHYLWPPHEFEMKVRVILSLLLLALAKVANVYTPILFRDVVDILSTKNSQFIVLPLALLIGYGMVRVLSIAFAELRDGVFAKVGQRAIRTVALETFRHLHNLALRFHLDRQTGGVTRSIERGTKGIDFLLNFMLFNILPTFLEILMVCGILWGLFNFWYAFVTFITVWGYIIFTFIVTEWRIKFRRQMNTTDNEANTRAIDSLLNYETVKYFGNEEHEALRFDRSLEGYERAAVLSKTSLSFLNIGQALIVGGGLVILLVMAGNRMVAGHMTIGEFTMIHIYLMQLFQPLNFLGFVYREIKQSLIDMEAMFNLLKVVEEVADKPGAQKLKIGFGEINFKNVSFGYEDRRKILSEIDFTIPANKTIAIVGPSGAGKSTVVRLLFRFYDVDRGSIIIDGQDIRSLTQNSVRAAIAIVPQDTVLFNESIFYNIQYGRPDANLSEIKTAAKLASIHDFIMRMPDGYETVVGERGLKLSGGEKQRVAIARAILKEPKIMVFDEATSALDTKTEREIQLALEKVSLNHTTLVIAHRLSTIIKADEILVFDQGHIVERGRHEELLKGHGLYKAMWDRQNENQLEQ